MICMLQRIHWRYFDFIDDIQRLGLGYVFVKDIRRILGVLLESKVDTGDSLYATSLYFRLLRLNGFKVFQGE